MKKWCVINLGNATGQALCDEEDYGYISRFNWYQSNTGYACRNVNNGIKTIPVSMARVIMGLPNGDEREVDHIDGNRLDNRKDNLRVCQPEENGKNVKKYSSVRNNRSSDLYKGVSFKEDTELWRARIRSNGKDIHLGYFDTEEEAARAYDEGAKKYHGEFASLNFPPRPVEKTLAEKFMDTEIFIDNTGLDKPVTLWSNSYHKLAQIAKEHYEKGGGSETSSN